MKLEYLVFACVQALTILVAMGAPPERDYFSSTKVSERLPDIILQLDKSDAVKIYSKAWDFSSHGFAAVVTKMEDATYDVCLTTKRSSSGGVSHDGSRLYQTISYQEVRFAQSFSCEITSEHEKSLTEALNSNGPFSVRNTLRTTNENTPLYATQEIVCRVKNKKSLSSLLNDFLSGLPSDTLLWRE